MSGAKTVARILGDSYVRIVNDTDLVARVPPFYRHTGKLFHFDFVGNLRPSSSSEDQPGSLDTGGDDGPAPCPKRNSRCFVSRWI